MLGQTQLFFFSIIYKKIPLVCILHLVLKYVEGVGVDYHHAEYVVSFVGECTEQKDPTPVLIPT